MLPPVGPLPPVPPLEPDPIVEPDPVDPAVPLPELWAKALLPRATAKAIADTATIPECFMSLS